MAAAKVLCSCGRKRADAESHQHRSGHRVFVYHRCECGQEWTTSRVRKIFETVDGIVDASEPVSPDEIIDVHKALADFDGPITELLP